MEQLWLNWHAIIKKISYYNTTIFHIFIKRTSAMALTYDQKKIKDKILNTAITASAIYVIPTLIGSLSRFFESGWNKIFLFHIIIAFGILFLFLFRNKFSLKIKLHFFCSLLSLIPILGLLNIKLFAPMYFIIIIIAIATLIQGRLSGLFYFIVFSLSYFIVFILNYKGIFTIKIDLNHYANNTTSWISSYMGILYGATILIYTISLFYKVFTETIKELTYSENRFRTFMDQYPYPISIKNSQLKVIYANLAINDLPANKEKPESELSSISIFPSDMSEHIKKVDLDVLISKHFRSFDIDGNVDGAKQHYRLIKFPLTSPNNEPLIGTISIRTTEQKAAEQMLINSERKYRSIFEGSIDGFVLCDEALEIIDCNTSFANILGYKKEEVLYKKFQDFLRIENTIGNDPKNIIFSEIIGKGIHEIDLGNKNDNHTPAEINGNLFRMGNETYNWIVIRDISERKQVEKKLYQVMVESEEKERERYAKEFHDGLGPILSTCMIYLNTLSAITDEKKRKEHTKRGLELLNEAAQSVREISNNLSPIILRNYGLEQAIKSFIEKLGGFSDIAFNIKSNLKKRYSEIIEITLYRTITELINNSLKYAEASSISIELNQGKKHLVLLFSDNGKGFNYLEVKKKGKGFGLINLENRIQKIGGKYDYQSGQSKGIDVIILLDNKQL